MTALPRFWRGLFWVEVVFCALTLAGWAAAPDDYLRRMFGLEGTGAKLLLLQGTNPLFTMLVFFYARLLSAKDTPLRVMRWFQEALAIGDVLILMSAPAFLGSGAPTALVVVQVAAAGLWLLARVVFLWRVRG